MDLLRQMKELAETLDEQGKLIRSKTPTHYKIREYFEAADALRLAAYKLDYVINGEPIEVRKLVQ